ncbi:MAG: serine/threonine-protein kinase [Planctomycetaceae bacterium]
MSKSNTSGRFTLDDVEQTMSLLASYLERFVDGWESSETPPNLADFLPDEGEMRRFTLVELIKIDLEYRWLERNFPKRIVEYVREFPELANGRIPADLVYEEYHVRRQSGFSVDPNEYMDAFPQQADELARLLGVEEPYVPSAKFNVDKHKKLEEVEVGQTIDEFDLLAELGKGAFAKVYLARQKSMQRLVALKVAIDNSTEPQTLAQLDHDYIVRVFDQRLLPEMKLRLLYMQYIAGGTLQSVLHQVRKTIPERRNGKLLLEAIDRSLENRGESRPVESTIREKLKNSSWPDTVCWIGARLAQALDYAHGRGVLHRDIKPANVLITADGVPKLADFNIAFSSKLEGATPAAYFGGSLAYMSPEQLEACNPAHERSPESLDGKSDQYSLGVMMRELLAGGRPFHEEEVQGGWTKTLEMMSERRRAGIDLENAAPLPDDCPKGLQSIIQKCMHPLPGMRWATGTELARRLEFCTKPHIQKLLYPDPDSWRVRLLPWTLVMVLLATIVPNALAAWWNYVHNEREIIEHLSPAAQSAFRKMAMVVNGVAFPVGVGLAIYLTWTVWQGIRELKLGKVSLEQVRVLESRCLRLGNYAAWIGVTLWTISGPVYPISINAMVGDVPLHAHVHFFASLALCGMVAAAYPFFLVTLFSLRVLYPALLEADPSQVGDETTLQKLGVAMPRFLVTAAALPLGAIALLLVTINFFPETLGGGGNFSMSVLSLGGAIGFVLIFWLYRELNDDLDAFKEVAKFD